MRTKKISYQIILLAMVLLPFSGFAQDLPPPNKGPIAPPPGLPINDHLPALFIAGLSLGIYLLAAGKAPMKVQ